VPPSLQVIASSGLQEIASSSEGGSEEGVNNKEGASERRGGSATSRASLPYPKRPSLLRRSWVRDEACRLKPGEGLRASRLRRASLQSAGV
jgi:hypothetical protein